MKMFLKMMGASLLLAASGLVSAMPMTLTDTTNFYSDGTDAPEDLIGYGGHSVNKLEHLLDYVSWKHQYTFEPAADHLLSGTLTLWLKDDERDEWWNPLTWEFGFGIAEDGTWDIGSVDTGTYGYDIDVASLEDGMFAVTLRSLGGDFYIKKSVLEIAYVASVPEPGTLALFGCGLLGLGLARRRKNAA